MKRFIAAALLSSVVACTRAQAPAAKDDSASRTLVIEKVLRYAEQEHRERIAALGAGTCLAFKDPEGRIEPATALMAQLLNEKAAQPRSGCTKENAVTLVAGPVEWIRPDEARVTGVFREPGRGDRSLSYRVIRENGVWVCAGPVVSWDPL